MGTFEDRKVYAKGHLDESALGDVPAALKGWLEAARTSDPTDYNAMTLSTIGLDGHPNARVVLLRSLEELEGEHAVAFYTNYESEKGRELDAHPNAAATFFWRELERQLRIRGRVVRMSEADSDRYFASRPRESRIGAWASNQSIDTTGRTEMEAAWASFDEKFGSDIPRPPHWGGYLLMVDAIEFWQGRPGRMHDRLVATRDGGSWEVRRLQP